MKDHLHILFRMKRTIVYYRNNVTFQEIKVSVPTEALQVYIDALSGANLARAILARIQEHVSGSWPIKGAIVLVNRKLVDHTIDSALYLREALRNLYVLRN